MVRCRRTDSGFTMIELVTVMLVLGALSIAALSGGAGWVQERQITGVRQGLLNEGLIALDRMVRELRNMRDRACIVCDLVALDWVPRTGPNRICFFDVNGNTIDYTYNAGEQVLYRSVNGADPEAMARNVGAFAFTYLRQHHDRLLSHQMVVLDGSTDELTLMGVLPDGRTYTNIRLIRMEMSLTRNGETVRLRTGVAPINLAME